MKKLIVALLTVVMAFSAMACTPNPKNKARSAYDITATLEEAKISGHMKYTLVNNTDNSLSSQTFMLYGNAYRNGAKHPAVVNDKAYYAGKSYGSETVSNVKVAGQPIEPEISGEDREIVTVSFNELFPDEKVEIEMDFCVELAKVNHRLGITPHTINLGGWYPTAVPFENGAPLAYPYYSIGDPFCTDVADYRVELTLPESTTVAGTGVCVREGNVARFTADNVRDFALVASKEFKTVTAKVGDVTVEYYYYNDRTPDASLKIATEALTYFESEIGAYPYPALAVCETGFLHGGMEYPALVMISEDARDTYGECIVHEIAHQWWYSAVGNDEVAHAWLDEGLTNYMTTLFYDAHAEYGQTRTDRIMKTLAAYLTYVDVFNELKGDVNTSMDRPLDQFPSEQEYVYMTYVKGELLFDTLRSDIGAERFSNAIKHYYKTNLHDRAEPADLIASFNRAAGRDLNGFFRSWLDGKVVLA